MSSTDARLKQLVDEHLDLGPNPDFDALLADTGMSSVEAVAFFKVVSDEFSLSMEPDDCLKFRTLRLLADYIDAHAA